MITVVIKTDLPSEKTIAVATLP